MKFIQLKCRDCGADIQLDTTREFAFCSYCGCKYLLKDETQKLQIEIKGKVDLARDEEINSLLFNAEKLFSIISIEINALTDVCNKKGINIDKAKKSMYEEWFVRITSVFSAEDLMYFNADDLICPGSKIEEYLRKIFDLQYNNERALALKDKYFRLKNEINSIGYSVRGGWFYSKLSKAQAKWFFDHRKPQYL